MLSLRHMTTAAALAAAMTGAACGGDDRLTREEYSAKLQPAVDEISAGFGAVFEEIGHAEESDRVPAVAQQRLSDAAARERRVARDLEGLEPPEDLEDANDRLVTGARSQADELDRLAGEEQVTVAQVADAIEQGASVEPLRKLGEEGVVKPPGAQH